MVIAIAQAYQPGGVRNKHADYILNMAKWQKARDTDAGEEAIKAAAEKYLPRLRKQNDTDYLGYLSRGVFYNATGRTIEGLLGMLFRKQAIVEAPSGLDALLKDVDMCGNPFQVFAQEAAEEVLTVGRVGILIDHTTQLNSDVYGPITVAKAQALNSRPFMKLYPTESIINWRFSQVNNVWTLIQVVLTEEFEKPAAANDGKADEFANVSETHYRVLDLDDTGYYRIRIFRIDTAGHDELIQTLEPLQNGSRLNSIPFAIINADGVGFDIDNPPLLDLINVNLGHWRVSADYEHGCHFTALPTLFISGYSPRIPDEGQAEDEIMLGSQTAITMTSEGAKANFIEYTGEGLGSIEKNLDRKEQQMAILGARMLATEGKAQQTATTTAIHRTGENSALAKVSIGISLGMTFALNMFAAWVGNATQCSYQCNRDFLPVPVDGPTLTALFAGVQNGSLNGEEMFDWLQRADVIEASVTFEEHQAGDFSGKVDPNALAADPPNKGVQKPPAIAHNPEKTR